MDIYFDLREIKTEQDFYAMAGLMLCTKVNDLKELYKSLLALKHTQLILLYSEGCQWLSDEMTKMFKKAHRHNRKVTVRLETAGRTY